MRRDMCLCQQAMVQNHFVRCLPAKGSLICIRFKVDARFKKEVFDPLIGSEALEYVLSFSSWVTFFSHWQKWNCTKMRHSNLRNNVFSVCLSDVSSKGRRKGEKKTVQLGSGATTAKDKRYNVLESPEINQCCDQGRQSSCSFWEALACLKNAGWEPMSVCLPWTEVVPRWGADTLLESCQQLLGSCLWTGGSVCCDNLFNKTTLHSISVSMSNNLQTWKDKTSGRCVSTNTNNFLEQTFLRHWRTHVIFTWRCMLW